jgi:hypothetical protein
MTNSSATNGDGINPLKKVSQMFIDLGQKSFGASKTCKYCGMVFVVGDTDDERQHITHCSKVLIVMKFY